jgi:uncharacterized protein with NRDE domain
MCTLLAVHRRVPGAPLLVAANRDEFLERPAEGPALRRSAAGWIVAPLDVRAGGTWLGVNARGVFAAVTNVSCPTPDPERRSRGLLVLDALAAGSAREAAEKAAGLPVDAYNPFNLFVADAGEAFALTYRHTARPAPHEGGLFVIGNGPLGEAPAPKVAGLRERVEQALACPPDGIPDRLAEICRDHTPGPRGALDAICVHAGAYGTRSSVLLRLPAAGPGADGSLLRFAAGAPCAERYDDFTPLLRELGRRGRAATGVRAARTDH